MQPLIVNVRFDGSHVMHIDPIESERAWLDYPTFADAFFAAFAAIDERFHLSIEPSLQIGWKKKTINKKMQKDI